MLTIELYEKALIVVVALNLLGIFCSALHQRAHPLASQSFDSAAVHVAAEFRRLT